MVTDAFKKAIEQENYEEATLLLDQGALLDKKTFVAAAKKKPGDKFFEAALRAAASQGVVEIAKYLCSDQVDINTNAKNNEQYNALMLAALHGHVEIVQILLPYAQPEDKNHALIEAINHEDDSQSILMTLLLIENEAIDNNGQALMAAVFSKKSAVASILLEQFQYTPAQYLAAFSILTGQPDFDINIAIEFLKHMKGENIDPADILNLQTLIDDAIKKQQSTLINELLPYVQNNRNIKLHDLVVWALNKGQHQTVDLLISQMVKNGQTITTEILYAADNSGDYNADRAKLSGAFRAAIANMYYNFLVKLPAQENNSSIIAAPKSFINDITEVILTKSITEIKESVQKNESGFPKNALCQFLHNYTSYSYRSENMYVNKLEEKINAHNLLKESSARLPFEIL